MIINLKGSVVDVVNPKLSIQIPNVYFDRRYSYKVGVHHIYVELLPTELNASLHDQELLCLNTNLVDRSSTNTNQTIFHFWNLAKRKLCQYAKVPAVIFYSLHLYELENATFELKTQFTNRKLDIQNILIQLEIIKIDAYGRV